MFSTFRNIPKLIIFLYNHWKFLNKQKIVKLSEVLIVIIFATLTVVFEAIGISIILPIMSYIESGQDLEKFKSTSTLTEYVVRFFAFFRLEANLLNMSIVALIVTILRQINSFINSVQTEKLKWNVDRKLQVKVFDTVMKSSMLNIQDYKIGHLSNMTSIEIPQVAAIFRSYNSLWMILLTLIAYISILILTSPKITLAALLFIGIVLILSSGLIRMTKKISQENLIYRNKYRDYVHEKFVAWKLIRLNNKLTDEMNDISEVQNNIFKNEINLTKISSTLTLIFLPVATATLLIFLNIFVTVLEIQLTLILTFGLVFIRIMPITSSLQGNINRLVRYFPSSIYMEETLNKASENIESGAEGDILSPITKNIKYKNITFSYPSRKYKAIKNISFEIKAGSFTAISGVSGAGKSTLVDMLPRLLLPDSGQILFDGTDINSFSLQSLRKQISYIPQDPVLFNMNIADNLKYVNKSASENDLWEALELANAKEFVEELPDKLNTELGVGGKKLSGGQRQRIILARAFLQRPSILILDEPTSALDQTSDLYIQKTISNIQKKLSITIILIAHRLSSLKNANNVILIKDGNLERVGVPSEVFKDKNILD